MRGVAWTAGILGAVLSVMVGFGFDYFKSAAAEQSQIIANCLEKKGK
ncbi:MAG: hypothetical protein ABW189_01555 [Rickettsiales bacterium]